MKKFKIKNNLKINLKMLPLNLTYWVPNDFFRFCGFEGKYYVNNAILFLLLQVLWFSLLFLPY